MLRALRLCLVALLVCTACVEREGRAEEDPPDDPDPIGLGGRGGWEGSNCMGAAYGITLLDEHDQLVTVRQSMAIGVVVDAIRLSSQTNVDGGLEVQVEGLDRFIAVGLRNWLHKIGEVLLPDAPWIASYDPDNREHGRGHYNLLGILAACETVGGELSPAVARTLAMFLYALSQMASCPDPEAAEADGNFVSVHVRLQPTESLAAQLPAAPTAPTLQDLFDANVARPIPLGASPDPSMTCLLWGEGPDAPPPSMIEVPPPTHDVGVEARATGMRCLVEGRVEAAVSTVSRFHPTFASGPAGEPVSFASVPVVSGGAALGQASPVRHFLADNHVGTIARLGTYTSCDDPSLNAYGALYRPCPAALARFHFVGVQVTPRPGALPPDLEAALAWIFASGWVSDALLVLIPFDAAPRCMAECPPESPAPSGESCS